LTNLLKLFFTLFLSSLNGCGTYFFDTKFSIIDNKNNNKQQTNNTKVKKSSTIAKKFNFNEGVRGQGIGMLFKEFNNKLIIRASCYYGSYSGKTTNYKHPASLLSLFNASMFYDLHWTTFGSSPWSLKKIQTTILTE